MGDRRVCCQHIGRVDAPGLQRTITGMRTQIASAWEVMDALGRMAPVESPTAHGHLLQTELARALDELDFLSQAVAVPPRILGDRPIPTAGRRVAWRRAARRIQRYVGAAEVDAAELAASLQAYPHVGALVVALRRGMARLGEHTDVLNAVLPVLAPTRHDLTQHRRRPRRPAGQSLCA